MLILTVSLLLATAVVGWMVWVQPSHDRDWLPEQAILPHVTLDGNRVIIQNLRDFRYPSPESTEHRYVARTYDLDRLREVWFVLSPFQEGWRGPAHAFLSFGFDDGQYVSVSVESRREVGESEFSLLKGMLRQYELIYVIGTEQDLLGLRAVRWNDPTYLYPIRTSPEKARELFVRLMQRAASLQERPEFYHTVTNNCATNLVDQVNTFASRPIPYGRAILFPGYSDELLWEMGLIDFGGSLDEARQQFLVNVRAQEVYGSDDFSGQLRQGLRTQASAGF